MVDKNTFFDRLRNQSLKSIPKSDLHNHAGRGGKISYIEKYTNIEIAPFLGTFDSLDEMDLWFKEHIGCYLPSGPDNYLKRVEANFVAATKDNVVRLALDFGLGEIYALGGMDQFIMSIERLRRKFASKTKLLPVLVIRELTGLEKLDEIFSYNWFDAIDIINYGNCLSEEVLKFVCCLAKSNGVKCKAHVGEYGTAQDVLWYVEELELDEVQHGIKVVDSLDAIKKLSKRNILYNVCPTSNIKLGLCKDYKTHPIKIMHEYGLKVTINTDDQLIFNASVSDEFMRLYKSGALDEQSLYAIYMNGMQE